MKLKKLLQTLKKEDQKKFEASLKLQKRKTFESIYKFFTVKTQSDDFDKEALFQLLFSSSYKKEKDYVLRNELRLFSQFIERYILQVQFEKEKNNQSWMTTKLLLDYYKEGQHLELFEEEWKEAFKRAKEQNDYYQSFQLLQQWLYYIQGNKEINPSLYQNLQELFWDYHKIIEFLSIDFQLEYQIFLQYIRRIFQALSLEVPTLPHAKLESHYVLEELPLQLQAKCHKQKIYEPLLTFEDKKDAFQDLIRISQELKDQDTLIAIYNNLGVEYFIRSNFKEAYDYYEKAYEILKQLPNDRRIFLILLNYISSSISLEYYEKAIFLYQEHRLFLEKEPRVAHNIERMIAITYLMQHNIEDAFSCMPHDINERPKEHYYYYRAIYALGYFIKKDYDLSVREVENAYKALKATPFPNHEYEKLFLALKHLVEYHLLEASKEKDKKKKLIMDYLNEEKIVINHIKKLIMNYLN